MSIYHYTDRCDLNYMSHSNEKRRRPQKSKKKSRDVRLFELTRLANRHLPVTINGLPLAKIIDLHRAKNEAESSQKTLESGTEKTQGSGVDTSAKDTASPEPGLAKKLKKRLSKKARAQIATDHISRVIKRDPLQAIYLSFMLRPSDPDFPFDLALLNFNLAVPAEYPAKPASIIVLNTEVPRGFAVNVERGFREIANMAQAARGKKGKNENMAKNEKLGKKTENTNFGKTKEARKETTKEGNLMETDDLEEDAMSLVDGPTLLSQVQTMDKYLEDFLKQEKRQTLKFVTFKNSALSAATPEPVAAPPPEVSTASVLNRVLESNLPPHVSPEMLRQRNLATDELTTKLKDHVKLFNKSSQGSRYKIHVPILLPEGLPELWTFNNNAVDVFLVVPLAYPEERAKLSVAPNFSTNLVVAKKLALESFLAQRGKSVVSVVEEAKQAEKNVRANTDTWISKNTPSLVGVANWVASNLRSLVLSPAEYSSWTENMHKLSQ